MQKEFSQIFYTTQDGFSMQVRAFLDVNGEVWFVAKDVCDILELADVTSALRTLDDDEKVLRKISGLPSTGGNPNMMTISESGLYTLIMRSNKPEAKKFRKWVTSEVLPQIRKTGRYETQEQKEKEIISTPVVRKNIKVLSRKGVPQGVMKGAEKILERTGLNDMQMTLALDKVFSEFAGVSVLEIAGIRLVAEEQESPVDEWDTGTAYETFRRWHWEHEYPSGKTEIVKGKFRIEYKALPE